MQISPGTDQCPSCDAHRHPILTPPQKVGDIFTLLVTTGKDVREQEAEQDLKGEI